MLSYMESSKKDDRVRRIKMSKFKEMFLEVLGEENEISLMEGEKKKGKIKRKSKKSKTPLYNFAEVELTASYENVMTDDSEDEREEAEEILRQGIEDLEYEVSDMKLKNGLAKISMYKEFGWMSKKNMEMVVRNEIPSAYYTIKKIRCIDYL